MENPFAGIGLGEKPKTLDLNPPKPKDPFSPPVEEEKKEDVLTEELAKKEAQMLEIKALHQKVTDALNGRLESEISMKDPYWQIREECAQKIYRLQGRI